LATAILVLLAGCGKTPETEGDSDTPVVNTHELSDENPAEEIPTNPGVNDDSGDQLDNDDVNDEMDLNDIDENNEDEDESDEYDVNEFENEWRQENGSTLTPNERVPSEQDAEQRRRRIQTQPDSNVSPPKPNPDGTYG